MKRQELVGFSIYCLVFAAIAAMGHDTKLFAAAWSLGGISAGIWTIENWQS